MVDNLLFAFGLTLFAGLSTGIGSAFAFFTKKTNERFLSASLGFSAGVMIYVSLVEIFSKAKKVLIGEYGDFTGYWITIVSFFGGMFFIALIDKLVPSFENPHEPVSIEEANEPGEMKTKSLMRMGVLSAIAIAIHNFPEGIATFTAALKDPAIGISIAVAIAIHNIPEGIAVSVPLSYAFKNKKKAFIWATLSGLAEPVGALIGYLILMPFMNETVFGIIFASVAGIMVFISLDQLLPTAEKYGKHHVAIYGLVSGMIVMAVSLLFFI